MKSFFRQYAAVILSMIFWALSFVWFKIANKAYGPITIIFIRLCIAVLFLSAYLLITKGFVKVEQGDKKYFFFLAFFEPFTYFLGESFGLTYVSSTVGSVIISTIPVFVLLFAWIIYRERLKTINYVGAIISFIGVLIFISNSNGTISINTKGLLLLLLAVVSAVSYGMVLHKLAHKYNPVFIVNLQNAVGALLFLPLFLIFDLRHFLATGFVAESFSVIVLLALFASGGAFVLFAYSVKSLGISKANVFSNLIPVFTAFFAFLLLNEKPTFQNILGMIIVITGLFLSQRGNGTKAYEKEIELTGRSA
jgi:drug/metabolite transporter (DMT)-like permease